MTTTTNNYFRKLALLLAVMLAALVLASGAALAVNKVCTSGTTQANPCSGTKNSDLLVGTNGPDYIKGLAGNDNISGGAGDDTTNGGSGNDTYSYRDGWGTDTLIDASGTDHLNFSAVGGSGQGVFANLAPELANLHVNGPNGARLDLSSGTVVEKVTGSSGGDNIFTGGATNTLRPGPSAGGAFLGDLGGCSTCSPAIPTSNDTYTGLAAGGYGSVIVEDRGGTSDRLVLPFASTDAYFEAFNFLGVDGPPSHLLIMTSPTDMITINDQLGSPSGYPWEGHIEQIQFTDKILSIGSETQTQSLTDATSAEAQVAALNEASNLDAAEQEQLSQAAKQMIEEPK
jgi:hemolysin type calcium-binding protein